MNRAELDWAFANIPLLLDQDARDFTITPMPGYTNHNYRLQCGDQDWVLRLPRARTNQFIDRTAEAHNQSLAHRLGLAPQVAWRNPEGVSLTPTLRHSRNIKPADFDNPELLAVIVSPLQRLHRSGVEFRGHEGLGELIERHYELLDSNERARFSSRILQGRRTLSLLQDLDRERVPSHRDPVLENLLLQDKRLWLIDWEYSAMASPYWDLATLCNEADLGLSQSNRLLRAYCAGGPVMKESILFDYRGLLKLFTDCWMALLAE